MNMNAFKILANFLKPKTPEERAAEFKKSLIVEYFPIQSEYRVTPPGLHGDKDDELTRVFRSERDIDDWLALYCENTFGTGITKVTLK